MNSIVQMLRNIAVNNSDLWLMEREVIQEAANVIERMEDECIKKDKIIAEYEKMVKILQARGK